MPPLEGGGAGVKLEDSGGLGQLGKARKRLISPFCEAACCAFSACRGSMLLRGRHQHPLRSRLAPGFTRWRALSPEPLMLQSLAIGTSHFIECINAVETLLRLPVQQTGALLLFLTSQLYALLAVAASRQQHLRLRQQ